MKKVTEKIIPQKIIKPSKKIVEQRWCDICNDEMKQNSYGQWISCNLCRRDLCGNHRVRDNRNGGDYYESFCTFCYETWYPALDELDAVHDKEEQALRRRIIKESLAR